MLKYCKEILQYYQHSIYSKDWLLVEKTSAGQWHNSTPFTQKTDY